jgi:hypothetical protein
MLSLQKKGDPPGSPSSCPEYRLESGTDPCNRLLCCQSLGYDNVFVGLQFVGRHVVGRQEQRITKKEELDIYVEFLRRRDFLKPSGARVIGQSWPVPQQW